MKSGWTSKNIKFSYQDSILRIGVKPSISLALDSFCVCKLIEVPNSKSFNFVMITKIHDSNLTDNELSGVCNVAHYWKD